MEQVAVEAAVLDRLQQVLHLQQRLQSLLLQRLHRLNSVLLQRLHQFLLQVCPMDGPWNSGMSTAKCGLSKMVAFEYIAAKIIRS